MRRESLDPLLPRADLPRDDKIRNPKEKKKLASFATPPTDRQLRRRLIARDVDSQSTTMYRRAASPTQSEPEVDILGSIYPGDNDHHGRRNGDPGLEFDIDGILNAADGEDDGDAEFIAQRQAASNRKASNLKGRTVKKGGGFQAMGMDHID